MPVATTTACARTRAAFVTTSMSFRSGRSRVTSVRSTIRAPAPAAAARRRRHTRSGSARPPLPVFNAPLASSTLRVGHRPLPGQPGRIESRVGARLLLALERRLRPAGRELNGIPRLQIDRAARPAKKGRHVESGSARDLEDVSGRPLAAPILDLAEPYPRRLDNPARVERGRLAGASRFDQRHRDAGPRELTRDHGAGQASADDDDVGRRLSGEPWICGRFRRAGRGLPERGVVSGAGKAQGSGLGAQGLGLGARALNPESTCVVCRSVRL